MFSALRSIILVAGALAGSLISANALAQARVRIAHLAPFAPTVEGTSVTIAVNGNTLASNVTYLAKIDYQTLPAGTYTITVTPTGATSAAITQQVTIANGRDYTVAAVGNGTLQPLSLLALEDDNTAATAGNLKLRVVHAAPFAAKIEDTAVSVRTDAGAVVAGLSNVPFNAASQVLQIPAANYNLKVASPDGEINLIDLVPLDLAAGANLTVFAIGDATNQTLGFFEFGLGRLNTESPLSELFSANWFNPATPGQGLAFHPVTSQDRIFGTWYTYDAANQPTWYTLDTCARPGAVDCDGTLGFNGQNNTATFSVSRSIGGVFNANNPRTNIPLGTLTVVYRDCRNAVANYDLTDGRRGTFPLTNLTPIPGCSESVPAP